MLLIAPFWADHDLGRGGEVRFELYEPDDPEREQRLSSVSEFVVNRTSGLETFNASWMMLVEWSNCRANAININEQVNIQIYRN